MNFPQLRVRTEYSFGAAFGPLARVAVGLKSVEASAAGIVDGGTWGHVKFAKEMSKAGIRPLFGTELVVPQEDGRRPVAWVLGRELAGFYQLSTAARREGACVPELFAQAARSCFRFPGAALEDPDCFDYVDLSPSSPLAARRSYELHKRTGKPLVLTSANAYPTASDRLAYLATIDREQVSPQYILSVAELRAALPFLSNGEFEEAAWNTREVAAYCATELKTAPLISLEGDLVEHARAGMRERLAAGHIRAWTDEYEARLVRELEMIASKKFESYFLVVEDLVRWAKSRMLVGPARGSSAGSLVCYLLRITEVDPIVHHLLFERFIDVTRSDLPDIDIDFSDRSRDDVFVYLAEKYGAAQVARIGSINTLKPKSVMHRACKKLGIPDHAKFDVINVLIDYADGDARFGHGLEDTFKTTEPGRRFIAKHPEAELMTQIENHASHTGVHAAGVIVCNEPVANFCTVGPDGVAQIDKPDAEKLNLLKIDALGLRTLGIIEDAGVVTADELYGLTLDDPEVFRIFKERRYEGVFQFEGNSQRQVANEVDVHSFKQIDHVTAIARPGPLGGGAAAKYIARAAGREEVSYPHPSTEDYLADTFGVILYQEQVMRICRDVGRMDWPEVSVVRKAISLSKGRDAVDAVGKKFLEGAVASGLRRADAETIWEQILTFGGYGMNNSHTVAYGVISYWCAWMKRYHPLEFAAASVRAAKDDDHCLQLLRDITREGVEYIPFDIERSREHWAAVDGKLLGGFRNLKGIGPAKAKQFVEARDAGRLTAKQREKIDTMVCRFVNLYPLWTEYRHFYDDPEAQGCAEGSVLLTADRFPEQGEVLWLGRVTKKTLRDENEGPRVARRGGKIFEGQSLFVDLTCVDDTGIPVVCRIGRREYAELGPRAMEKLSNGDVLLIRGRKVPNIVMLGINRVKCLTNPEVWES